MLGASVWLRSDWQCCRGVGLVELTCVDGKTTRVEEDLSGSLDTFLTPIVYQQRDAELDSRHSKSCTLQSDLQPQLQITG